MDDNVTMGCLGLLIIAAVIGLFVILPAVHFSSMGSGQHTGQITAVDERGYVFRNYDVYFKTDTSSSQEDSYCIHRDDVALIDQAKKLSKSRQEVTITYKGVRGFGWDLCHAGQIVSIEE